MAFHDFSKNYLNILISIIFLLSASGVFYVAFTFSWNDSGFAILSFVSSL